MTPPDTDLKAWVGRSETVRDQVTAAPVAALTATLDHPAAPVPPGTPLPPLWHWLYFLPMHLMGQMARTATRRPMTCSSRAKPASCR